MRAGPLSNDKVIDTLNRGFVNTWILRKELIALARRKTELGAFAAKVLERYEYPVDNLVFSADGTYRAHVPANSDGAYDVSAFLAMLEGVPADPGPPREGGQKE